MLTLAPAAEATLTSPDPATLRSSGPLTGPIWISPEPAAFSVASLTRPIFTSPLAVSTHTLPSRSPTVRSPIMCLAVIALPCGTFSVILILFLSSRWE